MGFAFYISMWVVDTIRVSVDRTSWTLPISEYSFKIRDIMFSIDRPLSEKNKKMSLCPNIITPDRIPEFCIPPKLPSHLEPKTPEKNKHPTSIQISTSENTANKKESLFHEMVNTHVIQVENVDELPYDCGYSDEESTNADPQSQAALSLPHLPKAQTSYGFCTLLESPHTRRKESLFHNDPNSCGIPIMIPRSRSNTYSRVSSSSFSLNSLTSRLSPKNFSLHRQGTLDSDTASSTESSPFSSPLLTRSPPKSSLFKAISQEKLFSRTVKRTMVARNNSLSTDEGSSTDNSPNIMRRSSECLLEPMPSAYGLMPPTVFPLDLVHYRDRVIKENVISVGREGNVVLENLKVKENALANVVLENLKVKENALSEFNVPFKVKAGKIGKLILKIPWKNLYNDAVVATLDGLYLLVVPGASKLILKIPWKNLYNDAVVATLDGLYILVVPGASIKYDAAKEEKYLREAKQKELLRIEEALQMAAARGIKYDAAKEEKYLQEAKQKELLRIEEALQMAAARENPKDEKKDSFQEKLLTQVIKNLQVKITNIHIRYEDDDSFMRLFTYPPLLWAHCSRICDGLLYRIHTGRLSTFTFFRPIFASAKLCINPHAEIELKSPKMYLDMEVQCIAIEMTKPQYLSMIDLLESVDCMVKNAPYRKYRPELPLHNNARKWWGYAITSISEVHIRSPTQMWLWSSIKKHRQHLRAYKTAYKTKLTQVWRGNTEAASGIDEFMTAEEKAKLYTAIGYSGSSHNLALPKEYVASVMTFKLLSTSITVREEPGVPETLKVQMISLSASISQRPGAQALKVEAKLEHWYVTGLQQRGAVPSLITSVGDATSSLLHIRFETNPEGSTADQLLVVQSQPVEIIYDARTVIGLAEFFQSAQGIDLEMLTSATLMKLEEIKEKTSTGLSHIIETRKVLDLQVNLKPSYLLVPQTGFYDGKSNLVILDFGSLQLNSVNQGGQQPLSPSFNSLEEIMDRAYEKFDLELQSVQLLYCKSGESWKDACHKKSSKLHILQPMDIKVQLAKSMVDKDARMAKFKVSGELPLLHVRMSDQKIKEVMELAESIPLPQGPSTPTDTAVKVLVELTRQESQETVLALNIAQLGTEVKLRPYDLTVTSYLKKVTLDYCEIRDPQNRPIHLISSSDKPGLDLLKVEFIKVDNSGPNFKATFDNTEQTLKVMSKGSKDKAIFDLKVFAVLDSFHIVCDERCKIADIKVQVVYIQMVLSWSLAFQAVSIVGDEVFSFNMALYLNATEGDAYTDTSNVDGKKFVNFQTAKEAPSVATAQAAEKAASSVRDFAQKSFRLSMDIKLKAPVIIIPQSSVSQNAVEADLGLITVQNQFCLVPADRCSLPPVIDKMDVQLTKLKLSRILLQEGSVQPNIELLQPVNLRASVKRNLAAAWYQKIPAIEINGDLKPMKVALSQDDLTVLLKIVMENIGEAANPQTETKTSADSVQKQGGAQDGSDLPKGSAPIKKESNVLDSKELYETMKFDFNFESLSLVLYNSDPTLKAPLSQRQDSLRLGEFILHLMTASGKMFEDGALEASTKLTACTLDDCRQGIQRVPSRARVSSVVAVLQKLYVCASVAFLLAVADFFIKAMPQGPSATPNKSNQLQLKQVNVPRAASEKAPDSSLSKMKIKAVIDPEVVFVASLMKADAPALACLFPVLWPACLTLETRMHQTEPLTAAVTVDAIIVKISPMILNTVMTIVAAMTPKAQEVGSQQKTEDVSNLWAVKNLNNCSYWFLGVDMASEVTDKFSDREGRGIGENLVVDVKLIQVTMESGLGHRTVPLLLAESSFKGKAQDWTSLLHISADMTLEVHYYNEVQAAWEPLIERVEDGRRRWNLKLEMKNNPIQDKSPVPGDDFVVLPEAQTAINICSKDTMNITISKCCLHVFTNLAKCLPLWPETTTGKLCVRVVGSETASKSFFFSKQDNGTLLGMDLISHEAVIACIYISVECGGIIAAVNIADHATVISFSDYYEGAAPALIINHTLSLTLKYQQSGNEELEPGEAKLKPGEAKLFAWNNPAAIRKPELELPTANRRTRSAKGRDESGQFCYNQNTQIHWVSFLDGRQRVLLFTEDVAIVTKARQAEEMEQFEKEINVSLQNLGLSLINNETKQEISYIGITSSGVVWEMKPKQRWKPFNQKNINLLEQTYQKHNIMMLLTKYKKIKKVNFTKFPMEMRHPFACNIRRNFLSGIQAEFKQSPHQRSLRAQVHWLQVDNQLPGAIFPIVFHPVPPPKSIALDSEPKPFIDVSIITRFNEHSQVMQFKYFMALVQEMALKIDQGFLGAIIALFTPATDLQADKQKIKLIEQDLEALKTELMETSVTDTSGLGFFEHLHISPIKFLKQMYVLVLGLDVLGNPFGLIRGLSEGVEAFFYEPFQVTMTKLPFAQLLLPGNGAVQGPEEFAEGFVIGVRSLLGHTVGGAAGVVSRITGSVGKGLAAITMDKEYQQKRREEMNRQPKDFGDSLAKGGKGLLWKEGAAGFFKGLCKGLVGVVARPTGGIVDMASSTFQGIQRVAESTEEVSKIRPPRLIQEDGIIRPFNQGDAEGYDLFQRSEIKKLEGELFREHCKVPGSRKTSLVVTNRRVMCLKEMDFVDHINKDWECLFENFTRPPSLQGSSLNIYTKIFNDL
ncbi:UNVERIFIED_CONTAM: hypothetical protein FKN15_034627 [Acipenser sinensis]